MTRRSRPRRRWSREWPPRQVASEMRLPLSGIDFFHHVIHRMIRRHGGAGNHGQLRLRLASPPDAARVDAAWRRAGTCAWTIGARLRTSLRGPQWIVREPARLALEVGDG